MILYSGLMFFVLWLGGLRALSNKTEYLIVVGFLISIISGYRHYSIGVDTAQYYFSFSYISSLPWSEISNTRYELGYTIMVKLLSALSTNPQFLLVITSIFINWTVMRFIYKYSPHYWLSTYLYISLGYYYNSMNLLRQTLAMSIVLLGIPLLLKKRRLYFILIVLLAMQFHVSAIIALLLPIALEIKEQKLIIVGGSLVGVLGFLFGGKIFVLISSINARYTGYSASNFAFENYFATVINAAVALVIILCYLYSTGFVFKKNADYVFENKKVKVEGIFLFVLIVYIVLELIAIRANIFERMTVYYSIFSIIIIPFSLNIVKDEVCKKIILLLIITFSYLQNMIILHYRPYWSGVVPYQFFN